MNIVTNRISLQSLSQVLPSTNSVMESVKKLALPVLGMIASSYLPTAESGVVTYATCIAGCIVTEILNPPPFWSTTACMRSCEWLRSSWSP